MLKRKIKYYSWNFFSQEQIMTERMELVADVKVDGATEKTVDSIISFLTARMEEALLEVSAKYGTKAAGVVMTKAESYTKETLALNPETSLYGREPEDRNASDDLGEFVEPFVSSSLKIDDFSSCGLSLTAQADTQKDLLTVNVSRSFGRWILNVGFLREGGFMALEAKDNGEIITI